MLRITQQTSSSAAKTYFSSADYFTEGQELEGVWRGNGAAMLGLNGVVQQQDWNALCDNLDPRTGQQLTARRNAERRVGWDCTISVPKSVSVLYALSRDSRILDAFNAAIDQTMGEIESELRTRVRKGGQNSDRVTGNGVWGRFTHFTSRPEDGIPDPQLHAHCFLFNSTFDVEEDRWKAVQIAEIKRDANYWNARMHSRLAHRLVELGIEVERTAKAWRVAGLTEATEKKFSRRTQAIEALAKERGITDPDEKAALGAMTREHKNKRYTMDELRALWLSWLTPDESSAIQIAQQRMQTPEPVRSDPNAARDALDYAFEHHLERESVVDERRLLTTALHHAIGQATPDRVIEAHPSNGQIIGMQAGRRMVTAPTVLEEERRMVAFARDGRNRCDPLAPGDAVPKRDWLNADQRRTLAHLCTSTDRVMVVRGAAGAGKTSLLQEAVEKIESAGRHVFLYAPSSQASRDVLRNEGFINAETVAYLLANPEAQTAIRDQVIVIDEAGLLGSRTMAKVCDLAERENARVILLGDRYQHKSVERGSALCLLEEEAGLKTAALTEIVRQRDQYKQAVAYLSQGRTAAGFNVLDRLKWVHELDDPTRRYEQLAAEYLQATEAGKSVLVVSPTHAEGAKATQAMRSALQHEGKIGTDEHAILKLTNLNLTVAQRCDPVHYADGDVVIYNQNAPGHRKGDRLTIGVDPVPLAQAKRFDVYRAEKLRVAIGDKLRITANAKTADGHRLNNGQVHTVKAIASDGTLTLQNGWRIGPAFGRLDYGFVSTSHSAQGKTVDKVLVAMSSESLPAINSAALYVSASRGRQGCSIYTDDKEAILEAASGDNEPMSATELSRHRVRERVPMPCLVPEPSRSEMTYDR